VTAGEVRPFPFTALEAMSRAEVDAGARLRRIARAHVRIESIAGALGALVGERVTILPKKTKRTEERGPDDAVGAILAPASAREPHLRVLVELEGPLAAAIASRALGQKAPRIAAPARGATPAIAGAAAAIVVAAFRRASPSEPLHVVAAGPGHALARDLLAAAGAATTAWLTVVVGADAFAARVSVPDAALVSASSSRFTRADLALLGDAPIALPVVAARTIASRSEVAALARGDAFVPPAKDLALVAGADGALVGPVVLAPPSSELGITADLAEGGRLVIRGHLERYAWDVPMPDEASRTIEVLEDAPVVVRVELGTVEMKAREWSTLGEGDVVSLGRRVGELAILRVGGVEVARGELVQVDGEYAVRIVHRSGTG
jgi:flagellar motor switch/type III secretory pathway protein FliN